ncbi:DUF2169 domain-containing protein [Agrobacterium tumefaciens]|nr:DUF2169 domain-containing protein [Agrobacterium tumefaciens]
MGSMWTLANRTPFAAFSGFDRDKEGRSYWFVWAKGTFRMRHGRSCLFERKQIDLFRAPVYRAEVGTSELMADTDIGLPKARPDFLLTGHAYRPASTSRNEAFEVSASIGSWSKSLSVQPAMIRFGRTAELLQDDDDAPVFLGFSNAFGGTDADSEAGRSQEFAENPLGLGYWVSEAAARGKALPRLYVPGASPLTKWNDRAKPAAFSAIPKSWPQRAQYSGTYDENWMRRKSPLLPDDLQEDYWQCVPADQQLDKTPPVGQTITLTNVLPDGGDASLRHFTTEMPTLQFELTTRFKHRWQETSMTLQTIHLFPDEGLLTLAYCGAMPLLSATNDVLVERSELVLRGHSGFRVRPDDMDCFDGLGMEV